MLLSRLKHKFQSAKRSQNRLNEAFRPMGDPLKPIERDLQSILADVKAVAIDPPTPQSRRDV